MMTALAAGAVSPWFEITQERIDPAIERKGGDKAVCIAELRVRHLR